MTVAALVEHECTVHQPASEAVNPATPRAAATRLPRALVIVLAVGLALRLAVVAWMYWNGQELYVWDEWDYDKLAVNLLRHGEFGFEPGQLTSIRPPLYPATLAAIYAVGGEHNYTLVRVLQALMAIATAWIVFALARSLYDERTGVIAAGVVACYPSIVANTGLILTETLFTCLLCTACLLMHQCLMLGGAWRFALLGMTLALGALTRSVLWLFPPVLLVFLIVCDPAREIRLRILHAGVAIIMFAAVIAPWAYRNTRLHYTFTAVDVMGGRNFMMGNYEHTPLKRPWDAIGVKGDTAWDAVLRAQELVGRDSTQGQIDKVAMKYGLDYVRRNPAQTLVRDVAKFFHFWQLERELVAGMSRGYWGAWSKPALLVAGSIFASTYMVVVIGGVLGWSLRPSHAWRMHVFLLLVIAFVCGIHTLVFAHSRYHLPLIPLLAIYAAAAWTAQTSLLGQWRRPQFWLAACVCILLAASWARELVIEIPRLLSLVTEIRGMV
jgi:4-amino-4-deoxy-L-arabinose transferase-like glycosyltransferase